MERENDMICEYCNTEHPEAEIANPHYCIARMAEEIERLENKIKEQDEAVYCPTCGACGEAGCCPPDRCEHLKCFYGEHYAKTYRELETENKRLRECLFPEQLKFIDAIEKEVNND